MPSRKVVAMQYQSGPSDRQVRSASSPVPLTSLCVNAEKRRDIVGAVNTVWLTQIRGG